MSTRESYRDTSRLAAVAAVALGAVALGEVSFFLWRRAEHQRRRSAHTNLEQGNAGQSELAVQNPVSGVEVSTLPSADVERETPTATAGSSAHLAVGLWQGSDQALQASGQPSSESVSERTMGLRTLLAALTSCSRVGAENVTGPFHMTTNDEDTPVVCFQFRMSHFSCKAYLASGAQDEGSQHLKLQTVFEDNRRSLGEEQRYFIANEWNATKRYTRLKCGSSGASRSSVFTLEYDILVPVGMPHSWGLCLLQQTLRMWYTSMAACVMHIVEQRDVPFATHEMITANTISDTFYEAEGGLQDQACSICFEGFRAGEKVRRLPCMHVFHVVGADADPSQGRHCNIDKHLVRDKQCPICKTPIDIMEQPAVKETFGMSSSGASGSDTPMPSGSPSSNELETATELVPVVALSTVLAESSGESSSPIGDHAGRERDEGGADAPVRIVSVPAQDLGGIVHEGATVNRDEQGPGLSLPGNTDTSILTDADNVLRDAAAVVRLPLPGEENFVTHAVGDVSVHDPAAVARLPSQAEELESAVRNLQTRWMQIQDVVAGMRQMLQFIEESRPLIAAAENRAAEAREAVGNVAGASAQGSLAAIAEIVDALPPVPFVAENAAAEASHLAVAGGDADVSSRHIEVSSTSASLDQAELPARSFGAAPRFLSPAASLVTATELLARPLPSDAIPCVEESLFASQRHNIHLQPFTDSEVASMASAWRRRCRNFAATSQARA